MISWLLRVINVHWYLDSMNVSVIAVNSMRNSQCSKYIWETQRAIMIILMKRKLIGTTWNQKTTSYTYMTKPMETLIKCVFCSFQTYMRSRTKILGFLAALLIQNMTLYTIWVILITLVE
jgi:hypothetical protein